MARKNRVHVPNGTYHVTSRLAERAHWLSDPSFKDKIVSWMHSVAEFCGVELLAWCVMDNHFHMLVYVPEVPEKYRLCPSESPDAYAFGMRPAECNPPLWSPAGDVPTDVAPRRPPTGFTLPDDEMVRRLSALY
ncbi:MAG: transposase, partial [Kiritimatiellae bacterium]|nr:transposase [Kiritimatiellia bacterium]